MNEPHPWLIKNLLGGVALSRYNPQKLSILINLREEASLSQTEVAKFFSMEDYNSVSAWEKGDSRPLLQRRSDFMIYLLDKLGLHNDYQQFRKVWDDVMVGEWRWDPLSKEELRHYFRGGVPSGELLSECDSPSGTLSLHDKCYIEREDDDKLKSRIVKRRQVTTIRGSRQTGKSSLLVRGLDHARKNNIKAIGLDLQDIDEVSLHSLDDCLRGLANLITEEIALDSAKVQQIWKGPQDSKSKLRRFMMRYILDEGDDPIVLAIDEADRLLKTDFYNDFFSFIRSLYNKGADNDRWERLNIVLVISTEPHLIIDDPFQSPFNVGITLYLQDFNESQVLDLNQKYGVPMQKQDLPAVIRLLNGHPYLTRKAFHTMVTERLSWADLVRVAIDDDGPFADHLNRQYHLLLKRPDLREALNQIVFSNRLSNKSEKAIFHLSRAGLIRGSGQDYTLRCELYRLYFDHKFQG